MCEVLPYVPQCIVILTVDTQPTDKARSLLTLLACINEWHGMVGGDQ